MEITRLPCASPIAARLGSSDKLAHCVYSPSALCGSMGSKRRVCWAGIPLSSDVQPGAPEWPNR
eukprot:3833830-Prymnesium_polylepis.1